MTPEQLVTVILAITGIVIQFILMYVPAVYKWYDTHPNKGLVTLGINAGVGVIYFGLGCVPVLADILNIALACNFSGAFTLLSAIFIIALGQQMAYGFLKNTAQKLRDKRLLGYG